MDALKLVCFIALTVAFFLTEINAGSLVAFSKQPEHDNLDKSVVTKDNLDEVFELVKTRISTIYEATKGEQHVKTAYFEEAGPGPFDSNELLVGKSETVPKFKFSVSEVSQYLNNSVEVAKDEVQKAVDLLHTVVVDQLQSEIQNYSNVLYECSKKHGIEQVPAGIIDKLQSCMTEVSSSAETYVNDFLIVLKSAPELVKNLSTEVFHCLDEMHNSTSRVRTTKAVYCITKAATKKGGEATGLAAEIVTKGFKIGKDVKHLVQQALSCYKNKLTEVRKELYKINSDVAKCTIDTIKTEININANE